MKHCDDDVFVVVHHLQRNMVLRRKSLSLVALVANICTNITLYVLLVFLRQTPTR